MENLKLFVATPMFGAQCAGIYADSMCQLYDICSQIHLPVQHKFTYNGSLITTLRTNLANEFMMSDATHLLFIDADIGFSPQYVLQLLNWQILLKFDIIGATYLKKNIHWGKVINAVNLVKLPHELNYHTGDYTVKLSDDTTFDVNTITPVQVDYLGAGFMLIPRATFNLFKDTFPQYTYGGGTKTLYFNTEIQDDKYVSEDVFFCNMVRKAGGTIGCCPWMKISHLGNHVYGGPPTEFN